MRINRPLLWTAYLIAFAFMVTPLLQTAATVWPPRFGDAGWRFGSTGLLSNSLLTSLLGLLLLTGLAIWQGHRKTLRGLSILSGLATLGLVSGMGLLTLDVFELRARVRPEAMLQFDLAAAQLVAKLLLAFVCCLLFTIGCWKSARQAAHNREARKRDSDQVSLIRRAASSDIQTTSHVTSSREVIESSIGSRLPVAPGSSRWPAHPAAQSNQKQSGDP